MKGKKEGLLKRYGHIWTVLYIFIYLPWFLWLEQRAIPYTVIYSSFDDKIPFNEYFIIPYLLWFLYIPATFIYFFFKSKEDYYRLSKFLFIGMSICLFICTIWPNGQNLRLNITGEENICTKLLSMIYNADTNTNVFPSIHVFNSVGVYIVLVKSELLKKKHWIKAGLLALTILICMSTVMLKQHSILDVVGGITLAGIMYVFVYTFSFVKDRKTHKVATFTE